MIKKIVSLLSVFTLSLLPTACQLGDEEEIDVEASYEYVCVEYESLQAELIEAVLSRMNFTNDTDRETDASCTSADSLHFSSHFRSDFFPEGDLSNCKIPPPRVDRNGDYVGLAMQHVPLSDGKRYDWMVRALFSQPYRVPANTTIRESILECGFEITADFRLTLRNSDTGKLETFGGTWSGRQLTHQIVQVEYPEGPVQAWEHPVEWP